MQEHPNQKPLELIKLCIEKHSNIGDVILDTFMGSGTSAVACIESNRQYIGFEIDQKYYDIAIRNESGIEKNGQLGMFANHNK